MNHPPSSAAKTLTREQIEQCRKEIHAVYDRTTNEIIAVNQICDMALASITQPAAVEAMRDRCLGIVKGVKSRKNIIAAIRALPLPADVPKPIKVGDVVRRTKDTQWGPWFFIGDADLTVTEIGENGLISFAEKSGFHPPSCFSPLPAVPVDEDAMVVMPELKKLNANQVTDLLTIYRMKGYLDFDTFYKELRAAINDKDG